MRKKNLLILLIVTLLAQTTVGCYPFTQLKLDRDHYYTFKHHPIKVKAPDTPEMGILDGDNYVDFAMGAGAWMMSGRHSIQVYPIPESVTDEQSFYAYIKPTLTAHAVKDPVGAGLKNMEVKRNELLRVHDRPAYEVWAVDEKGVKPGKSPPLFPAATIVTAIYFESRIVIASYLTSSDLLVAEAAERQFRTKKYRAFVESIEEIKTR